MCKQSSRSISCFFHSFVYSCFSVDASLVHLASRAPHRDQVSASASLHIVHQHFRHFFGIFSILNFSKVGKINWCSPPLPHDNFLGKRAIKDCNFIWIASCFCLSVKPLWDCIASSTAAKKTPAALILNPRYTESWWFCPTMRTIWTMWTMFNLDGQICQTMWTMCNAALIVHAFKSKESISGTIWTNSNRNQNLLFVLFNEQCLSDRLIQTHSLFVRPSDSDTFHFLAMLWWRAGTS